MSELHTRLREWRSNQKLTQEAAGERFGLSQAAWCELEQGRRDPTRDTAILIEHEIGIPIESWSRNVRVAEAMQAIVRRRRRGQRQAV